MKIKTRTGKFLTRDNEGMDADIADKPLKRTIGVAESGVTDAKPLNQFEGIHSEFRGVPL